MCHVQRIAGLSAHPLSKRLVVWEQRSGIPAGGETVGLRVRTGVEQAHGDRLKP